MAIMPNGDHALRRLIGGEAALSLKIYIVDDDADIIAFMTLLLEAAGHKVSSSVAGATALPEIKAKRPDCVLIDLVMAEMDGLDLCRELRKLPESSGLKVIFVSARANEYWRHHASDAGADGYLGKPLDADTFVRQVEDIVEGRT